MLVSLAFGDPTSAVRRSTMSPGAIEAGASRSERRRACSLERERVTIGFCTIELEQAA
jgi:hypothetical protein